MEFFNQSITRMVATSLMDFFSRISIEKFKTVSVSGDDVFAQRKIIPVPIQWATREKWVEIVRSSAGRKAMDPAMRDLNPVEMQWILPRISCNLISMNYDETRRLVKTQTIPDYTALSTTRGQVYSPAPYTLNFEVSTIARHLDDNLQIMEQILPYFAPTMSLSLNLYDDRETESVPITLNSVSMDNPTDIPEFEERVFTNVYQFSVKINYYMMKKMQKIIDNVTINLQAGNQIVQMSKTWLESQQRCSTRFTEYTANASRVNPFIDVNGDVPNYTDPTRVAEFVEMQRLAAISEALSGTGHPVITGFADTSGEVDLIYLSITASGYDSNFNIYYRTNLDDTIMKYESSPISAIDGMTNIYAWADFTDQTDVSQFGVNDIQTVFGIGNYVVYVPDAQTVIDRNFTVS